MSRAAAWLKQNGLLALLFAVGAAVRLVYAGEIPGGLNQDEASSIIRL